MHRLREEEKARREIERALKEAAKEEEALQRALDKVRLQVAKASDEQRAAFEAKLAELQGKLSEAESRNRRALSMAQQTKAGHVYGSPRSEGWMRTSSGTGSRSKDGRVAFTSSVEARPSWSLLDSLTGVKSPQ